MEQDPAGIEVRAWMGASIGGEGKVTVEVKRVWSEEVRVSVDKGGECE